MNKSPTRKSRKPCKKNQSRSRSTKRCRKKPCKSGQTRDRSTKRCRNKKSPGTKRKKCDEGQFRYKSNRCRSKRQPCQTGQTRDLLTKRFRNKKYPITSNSPVNLILNPDDNQPKYQWEINPESGEWLLVPENNPLASVFIAGTNNNVQGRM